MIWNRRTDARFHKIQEGCAVDRESIHGHRLVPNNESDWIVVRDAHPPLISRRLFERARQRREGHPSSMEQRGQNPRAAGHGKTWHGQRSRFILSGLLSCARCGHRYQGMTRSKGKKRQDGTRIKTRSYACGGYITKGRKICEMNSIRQADLEEWITSAVLDFYGPYSLPGGRRKLCQVVKQQLGSEGEQFEAAVRRAKQELRGINTTINSLLDNITPANREPAEPRLRELADHRRQLESRLEELDRLSCAQTQISAIVSEAQEFLSGLEFTLRQGLPQEKLCALRQCMERVLIDKAAQTATIRMRLVPGGVLQGRCEIQIHLKSNTCTA